MSKMGFAFSVAVALIVASPNAMAVAFQTVSQTATGSANGVIDLTPQCPAGFAPIAGGWRPSDPSSEYTLNYPMKTNIPNHWAVTPRFALVGSHPNGNGWRTFGFTNADVIVEVYTVCASG